jgi:hypothetical protein
VPDVIFVTSVVTYWYSGVFEVIGEVKRVFPQTPVILGGIYATVCQEHAVQHSGADHVVSGNNNKPPRCKQRGIKRKEPYFQFTLTSILSHQGRGL